MKTKVINVNGFAIDSYVFFLYIKKYEKLCGLCVKHKIKMRLHSQWRKLINFSHLIITFVSV